MVSELTKTAIGLFFDILDVLISLLPNAPFAAMLATLSNDSGIPVLGYINYFIPFKFCERGSNENANKLIRRWIPKGAHISEFTDKYIKDIEEWINNYPRKLFNYLSSKEYKILKVTM